MVIGLFFALSANNVYANTKVETNTIIHSKDTFSANIFLDTEGKDINVIEGSIKFNIKNNKDIKIKDISEANSAVSVWSRKPSLSVAGNTITFSGGSLNSINSNHTLLFTVFVEVDTSGSLNIEQTNIVGYLSDGLGTKISYKNNTDTFAILSEGSKPVDSEFSLISGDNEPPLPFTIELLQDPNINSGMKYLSFETTDSGSGMDRYEVIESNNKPIVTGSSYVPLNQESIKNITVMAYDKAGNVRVETYNVEAPSHTAQILLIMILLILIFVVYKLVAYFLKKHAEKNLQ